MKKCLVKEEVVHDRCSKDNFTVQIEKEFAKHAKFPVQQSITLTIRRMNWVWTRKALMLVGKFRTRLWGVQNFANTSPHIVSNFNPFVLRVLRFWSCSRNFVCDCGDKKWSTEINPGRLTTLDEYHKAKIYYRWSSRSDDLYLWSNKRVCDCGPKKVVLYPL